MVLGERAFLNRLGGSCQVPVAGHGKLENGTFTLTGLVAGIDGSILYRETHSGPANAHLDVGVELAERLLDQGAAQILESLNEATNNGR